MVRLRPELDVVGLYPERRANGYEGELPQIVGDVSPDEQEAFSSFPDGKTGTFAIEPEGNDDGVYEQMRSALPSVWRAIETDSERLGFDPSKITCTVKRGTTTPGEESFRPDDEDFGWHTDQKLVYVVSDELPTKFYQGPVAPLKGHKEGRITPLELDTPGSIVTAPPYAIVRIMPYTPHRADVADTSAMRTFMSFEVQPRTS